MQFPTPHSSKLDRVQKRIARLAQRARALEERETAARAEVERLQGRRGPFAARRLARAQRRATKAAEQRHALVTEEFTAIMRTLHEEAKRMRAALDRALAPLASLAMDWGQIEKTFELLDEATGAPELKCYVGEHRGRLVVPEFPVREATGYVTPFPSDAFVF
jgi:chromosome segregation ATPase